MFYKVLHKENKTLVSGNSYCQSPIRYVKNKWAYPKPQANQFLFVFDTLENARRWAVSTHTIYECKVGKVLAKENNIEQFKDFFTNTPKDPNKFYIYGFLQPGTVLVDKVKITKRVK